MGKGEGLKGFSKDITAFPKITSDTDRTAVMLLLSQELLSRIVGMCRGLGYHV